MSNALQIAMFAACVAIVIFVTMLIPLSFLLYHYVRKFALQLNDMKAEVTSLMHDVRTMVQNLNQLTSRANQQLDDLGQIIRVLQGWSAKADRVVTGVSTVVEAPFGKLMRSAKRLREIWSFVVGERANDEAPSPGLPKHGSQVD